MTGSHVSCAEADGNLKLGSFFFFRLRLQDANKINSDFLLNIFAELSSGVNRINYLNVIFSNLNNCF